MRKVLSLFVLATMLLTLGFVSANNVAAYQRPCDSPVDICTWTTDLQGPLPLGSENCCGCGLSFNTYWPVDTNAVATCVFDGDDLENAMLYVSINNDIVSCTLNNVEVISSTAHEGCAAVDPRDGISADIYSEVVPGQNTLVCTVADRGMMTHFDACVVGDRTTPIVPEFGTWVGILTALGALGVFFVVRRK